MLTRLKVSRSATGLLSQKYNSLRNRLTPNLILRNALTFSLNQNDKYNGEKIDSVGTEFQISTLLGSKSDLFFMLIEEHYDRKINDTEMGDIISFHIDKGLKDEGFISIF